MTRNWVFSLHHHAPADHALFKNLDADYILLVESDASADVPSSLHGYIQFKNRKCMNERVHPRCQWEHAKEPSREHVKRCKDLGTVVYEHGILTQKGVRNAMTASRAASRERSKASRREKMTKLQDHGVLALREAIKERPLSRQELYQNFLPVMAKYPFAANMFHDMYHPPIDLEKTENLWFWGPSSDDRLKKVCEEYPSHYMKSHDRWWDLYDMQETVIVSDLSIEDADRVASYLKVWAGRCVFEAPIRYACRLIRPKRIIVTSRSSIYHCFRRRKYVRDILPLFSIQYCPDISRNPQ